MKGYRGVIKGLWVRGLNCLLPAFAMWVIFWLSRIHFRVHSPQGGNRCLLEDQRLVNTCVGIFGTLHTNICIRSGVNRWAFWWLCFFQCLEGVTCCFTWLFDMFLCLMCAFLKFPFLFLPPLWISGLIWMCNVVSLNVAHALCAHVTLNTSSSATFLLFLSA